MVWCWRHHPGSLQRLVLLIPTYTFGIVPQFDAQRIYETWQPILNEIEKMTGLKFKLTGSLTIPAFETQFMVGEFDFAYMNPYHALKAAEAQRYIPQVRDVGRSLHGIIVVPKNSPITSVQELEGKTVAFPATWFKSSCRPRRF